MHGSGEPCMVRLICVIFIIITFNFCDAYAENIPQIEGEPYFNQTAEELAKGSFFINPADIIKDVLSILFDEIIRSKEILMAMLMIGVASALASLIHTSFESKSVGGIAFYGCFCIMCASAVECFSVSLRYAKEVIGIMHTFVTKFTPVISTALLLSGKVASASVFHPFLSTGAYAVSFITEKWIIPLITYHAVLSVVNNMSTDVRISGVCKLINGTTKWILAASFTLFSGLCGIYGFGAPAIDVMGAKTMKFAVGSLVPVVGGFLSDTLDTVISGGALMKSAVGGAGIASICVMCAVPIIKISVIIFMMKITAAIAEPITDKRISQLLWDISSSVTMLFAMVVTMAVLFIVCISIIAASTR